MPRRSFGKYEVLARLATGGAASIFLARQPGAAGFHKLVVLKTLLPERAIDADFVAMFLDEARLAARLNHPNCVQIYDLGRVRGVYYISMEYIFGETLWNLLTTVTRLRTPLPPAHVASILASACDGLHHAHELKDPNGKAYHLVHRDVS
ncbi:MAG: protein kinase, partial [Deltaproteobacteria bacterium]